MSSITLSLKDCKRLLDVLDDTDARYYVGILALSVEHNECYAVASDATVLLKIRCLAFSDVKEDKISTIKRHIVFEQYTLAKAKKLTEVVIEFTEDTENPVSYPPYCAAFPSEDRQKLLCSFDVAILRKALKALPEKGFVDVYIDPYNKTDEALTVRPILLQDVYENKILVVPSRK